MSGREQGLKQDEAVLEVAVNSGQLQEGVQGVERVTGFAVVQLALERHQHEAHIPAEVLADTESLVQWQPG